MILDFIQPKVGGIAATAPIMGGAGSTTVTSIGTTTATLGGTYTSDGGSPITATGFVLYPAGNPSTVIGGANVTNFPDATLPSPITADATSLTSGTNYCFKPYAINAIGTSYGVEVCFTTLVERVWYGASNAGSVFIANKNTLATIQTITGLGTISKYITKRPFSNEIWIGDEGANLIRIYDYDTYASIGTISLSTPQDLAFSSDGLIAYCPSQTAQNVKRIDCTTKLITHTSIGLGGNAFSGFIDSNGNFTVGLGGLISNNIKVLDSNTLAVLGTYTLTPGFVTNIEGGLSYGGFQYIVSTTALGKFDSSYTLVSSITGLSNGQNLPVIRPQGDYIYVAEAGSGSVKCINVSTFSIQATIPGFSVPANDCLSFSDNGNKLFVTNFTASTIKIVDSNPSSGTFNTILSSIATTTNTSGIDI